MENIKQALKEYGLNDKEIQVYQSCLKLGTASITEIAKKAEVKRPTCYLVIDELKSKGLIIAVPKGKKTIYKTIEPDKLLDNFESKRQNLEEVIPFLRHWYDQSRHRPKVTFFEGKVQIKDVYKDMFKAKEIWSMVSLDKLYEVITDEENEALFKLLDKQGGKIYDLIQYSTKAKKLIKAKYRKENSEEKLLPKDFVFETDIIVNDKNKVAIISLDNLTATIIDDEAIAHTMRAILKFFWEKV